jgi:hypothetical protein
MEAEMRDNRWVLIILCFITMQFNINFVFGAEKIGQKITDNKLLIKLLTYSEMTFLNKLDQKNEKNHIIRIFKLPEMKSDSNETELVSGYHVYIGVCDYDEDPVCNVFYIGKTGEINAATWGKSSFNGKKYLSNIVLKTTEYSSQYYRYYPKTKIKNITINLKISTDGISITKK